MHESRTIKIISLGERIGADAYDVDPHDVAHAILARLLAPEPPAGPPAPDQCS